MASLNLQVFSSKAPVLPEEVLQSRQVAPLRIDCTGATIELYTDDFGQGIENPAPQEPAIAPDFTYATEAPLTSGEYALLNSTAGWAPPGAAWVDTGDNSSEPNGYMAVFAPAADTSIIWTKELAVCPGIELEWSVDILNLSDPATAPADPPVVDLLLNGELLSSLGPIAQDGAWQNFTVPFDIIPDTALSMLSLRLAGSGGIAIDNLALRSCGPTLTATEVGPQPHCPGDEITLQVTTGAGFLNPVYRWQVSIDGGVRFRDAGAPTSQATFTVQSVPPNALFRVLAAPTLESLELGDCIVTSDTVFIQYQPIETCFSSPVSVIGDLCQGFTGANLVEGGDFGEGEEPFGPPLEAGVTTLSYAGIDTFPNPGEYLIANTFSGDPCQGAFPDTCWVPIERDTTDSLGYKMIVNATGEPAILFQKEVTDLCEDTPYQFSVEVRNLSAPFFYPNDPDGMDTVALPNIDLIVAPVGTPTELLQAAPAAFNSGDITNDTTLRTIGFTFELNPGETDLLIALRNNGPDSLGNNFVLDNVLVAVCGPESLVNRETVCPGEPMTLEAEINGDQFPDPALQWIESTDGGMSWAEVPGATARTLALPNPVEGTLYSYLVAVDAMKLQNPNCRINAAVDTIGFLPSPRDTLQAAICDGESFSFGGMVFASDTIYTDSLLTTAGCDSLVTLDLSVQTEITTPLAETICEGESISIGDETFTETGNYQVVFQRPGTCDSIVDLQLLVLPAVTTDLAETICEGQSVPVGDTLYTEPGFYSDTLLSVAGCDSIVNLTLEVIDQLVTESDVFLCPGDSFQGLRPESDTTLVDTLQSVAGCDSLILTNLLVSQVDELQIMGDTSICTGVSTVLDAGVQSDYTWSTGATTPTIEVNTPGTYSVTVTDTLGCVGSATVSVMEEDLVATVVGVPPTCAGDADGSLAVQDVSGSAGPFQYALDGGPLQDTPIFNGLAAGDYEVSVIDPKGCSYQELITLDDPPPLLIDLDPQIDLLAGDSVQLSPVITPDPEAVRWEPAQGLSCTDCLNPIASPSETTAYSLTAEDANGCRVTAEVLITVDNARIVYIPNAFSPNGDGVNDFFTIFGGGDRIRQIDRLLIFDRWGGQVFEVTPLMPGDEQAGWDGTQNGLQCKPGVYVFFAEITFNDGVTEIFKGDLTLLR